MLMLAATRGLQFRFAPIMRPGQLQCRTCLCSPGAVKPAVLDMALDTIEIVRCPILKIQSCRRPSYRMPHRSIYENMALAGCPWPACALHKQRHFRRGDCRYPDVRRMLFANSSWATAPPLKTRTIDFIAVVLPVLPGSAIGIYRRWRFRFFTNLWDEWRRSRS
jgi:hypothetical protein